MAIFPNLILEDTVQVNDKTRLDGTKSFISSDEAAITLVRIKPSDTDAYVTVTSDKYLDWSYSGAATETVTIEITTDGSPTTFTKTISVVTSATDDLWSDDADLVKHEPDIMNYVPEGKNSFINIHRLAQSRILCWLDEKRIWDNDGNRLTATDVDGTDMNEWSKYLALQYIYEGLSNSIDDIFFEKASRYRDLVNKAANRAVLRLDLANDGTKDEKVNNFTGLLLRR